MKINILFVFLSSLLAAISFASNETHQLDLFEIYDVPKNCKELLKPAIVQKEQVGHYYLKQVSHWLPKLKGFAAEVEVLGPADGNHPEWSKNHLLFEAGSKHVMYVEKPTPPILRSDIKYRISLGGLDYSNQPRPEGILSLDAGSYTPETSNASEFRALPEEARYRVLHIGAERMGSLRVYNFSEGDKKDENSKAELPASVLQFAAHVKSEFNIEFSEDSLSGMGEGNGWVTIGRPKYSFEIVVHVDGTILGGRIRVLQERGEYRDESDKDPITGKYREAHFDNEESAKAADIDFDRTLGWSANGTYELGSDGALVPLNVDNSFHFLGY